MGLWERFKGAIKPAKQEKRKTSTAPVGNSDGPSTSPIPLRRADSPPRPARRQLRKGFALSKKAQRNQSKRERHRGQFLRVLKRIQGERKGGYIPAKFVLDNSTDIEMGKETSRIGFAINRIARNRRMRGIQKESRRRNRGK